jgi:hypothetical protein
VTDSNEKSSDRYRAVRQSFLGPLAYNRWGMFWMGWIFAALIAQYFDASLIGLVGVIAVAIISVRLSLSTRRGSPAETSLVASQHIRPSNQPGEASDESIGGIRYVFRGVALWLVLALLFLLIVKIVSRAN